ncbi:hypothetical protein ACJX0J_041166 [Zea mays]
MPGCQHYIEELKTKPNISNSLRFIIIKISWRNNYGHFNTIWAMETAIFFSLDLGPCVIQDAAFFSWTGVAGAAGKAQQPEEIDDGCVIFFKKDTCLIFGILMN